MWREEERSVRKDEAYWQSFCPPGLPVPMMNRLKLRREDSDVDLFFDYERGKFGLFQLMDVKEFAASVLGTKTDIMSRDSIHRGIRAGVETSALQVF